jgi:hypothetical protein
VDDVDEVFCLQLKQVLPICPRQFVKVLCEQLYRVEFRKLLVWLFQLLNHVLALTILITLPLFKGKVDEANQDVVEIEVLKLIVGWNPKLANKPQKFVA